MFKVHYICIPMDGDESFGDFLWIIATNKQDAIKIAKKQLEALNKAVFISFVENERGEVM